MAYKLEQLLYHGSAVAASTVYGSAFEVWEFDSNQWVAALACTLKSGSGNLDVKFQTLVPGTATWVDLGVSFAQKTGTASEAKAVTIPATVRVAVTVTSTATYDIDVWASGRAVN